jgi:hypothetical protein
MDKRSGEEGIADQGGSAGGVEGGEGEMNKYGIKNGTTNRGRSRSIALIVSPQTTHSGHSYDE